MPSSEQVRCSEAEFTSAAAADVMRAACRTVGLSPDGAKLIRFGENALFRLCAHPVIVRVARSLDYLASVRTEVAVSRWLAGEGVPAARLLDDMDLLVTSERPVTFWQLIEEAPRRATYGELGGVLRDLHSLKLPEELVLPSFSVFGRTELRIERVDGIPEGDRQFLRDRARELKDRLAGLRFDSPRGPVHGDAHVQNLMVDRAGRVVLIDFEAFGFDHPEWDLMVTATEHHSLGWQTAEQYAAFVDAYGRDLRDSSAYPLLRDIQEFRMTTWLMQNIGESPAVAEEYARRIASLRDRGAPRNWRAA